MIRRLLIANRGEIALRCIRACRELDITSIAIYPTEDRDSLHVSMADEAVQFNDKTGTHGYLDIKQIIEIAQKTHAQAIFPGYGYLSENPDFPKACEAANILFVGPSSDVIASMGNKSTARKLMLDARIPVIPGSIDNIRSHRAASRLAKELDFPVIIKATAGGGGRGMRIVREEAKLRDAFNAARREAGSAFGNDKVYLEKYIEDTRHVEIQIVADNKGNVVHLGERECSIQRRYQKLIEESPSPCVDESMREKMGAVAVRAARSVGYESVGTVEFVVRNSSFYFIEMNTRIQVEHPVTEILTGIDLVRSQILIAMGEPLPYRQQDISFRGHAMECRINAEDTENNFMPCPGTVVSYHSPGGPGVRVDSHLYSGYTIPHSFDSLIAKLISHAHDREHCISRMKRALGEYIIEGVETTIPFHLKVLESEGFLRGEYTTGYLEHVFSRKTKSFSADSEPPVQSPTIVDGVHGCFDSYE